MVQIRIDRHRCLGAGTCILLAPTAFTWYKDEFMKAAILDADSVDEQVLVEVAYACPTMAIILEDEQSAAAEVLGTISRTTVAAPPAAASRSRTFMFTDIVRSTNLIEAIGDEAWASVLRWHDETLQRLFAPSGEVVNHTGDGFFVAFEEPGAALSSAVNIQRALAAHRRDHGFAPELRIGLHTAAVSREAEGYRGRDVHVAARIAALAGPSEILASSEVLTSGVDAFPVSEPRKEQLRGISAPVDVVTISWR